MTQTDFTKENFSEKDTTVTSLPNATLTAQARETLSNCWGKAIQGNLLYLALAWGLSITLMIPLITVIILSHISGSDVKAVEQSMKIGIRLVQLLLGGAFSLGLTRYFLLLSRESEHLSLGDIFYGFKHFGTALWAYLQIFIRVLIGLFLFIIPGIIFSYRYSQTYFILAEDPICKAGVALKQSAKLMRGKKWKLFCLQCRFIGWSILATMTLGIGYIWLIPYMQTSFAKFYDDLLKSQGESISERGDTEVNLAQPSLLEESESKAE